MYNAICKANNDFHWKMLLPSGCEKLFCNGSNCCGGDGCCCNCCWCDCCCIWICWGDCWLCWFCCCCSLVVVGCIIGISMGWSLVSCNWLISWLKSVDDPTDPGWPRSHTPIGDDVLRVSFCVGGAIGIGCAVRATFAKFATDVGWDAVFYRTYPLLYHKFGNNFSVRKRRFTE